MQPKACNNGPHESDSSLPTALQLVTALTENQHQRLLAHAAKRMRRLLSVPEMERCLARKSPDDIVHDSLQKVLHHLEPRRRQIRRWTQVQLPVSSTETIEAIAAASGYSRIAVVSAIYTIDSCFPSSVAPTNSCESPSQMPPAAATRNVAQQARAWPRPASCAPAMNPMNPVTSMIRRKSHSRRHRWQFWHRTGTCRGIHCLGK